MTKIPSDKTLRDTDGISRRTMLGGAAVAMGVGAAFVVPTTAFAKTSQKDAKYQDKPQGESKCGNCMLFQPPDACQAVDGKVSPEGWCSLYSKKAG